MNEVDKNADIIIYANSLNPSEYSLENYSDLSYAELFELGISANAFNKNFDHNKLLNVHYFNYRHEKIVDMNYISKVVQRRTFIENYHNYYHDDNILAIDD